VAAKAGCVRGVDESSFGAINNFCGEVGLKGFVGMVVWVFVWKKDCYAFMPSSSGVVSRLGLASFKHLF
jgi:hypothetical protein